MFHADLSRVFHLLRAAAHHCGQAGGGHRAGHTDLALAADFGTADRGVQLVQHADRGCGHQEVIHAALRLTGLIAAGEGRNKAVAVMQHRRNHPGGAIGGCRHDPATRSVFFIHRKGVDVDPIQHRQWVGQGAFGAFTQLRGQLWRAALHLVGAGQGAGAGQAALHTFAHHLPDALKARVNVVLAAPGALVGPHHLADAQSLLLADG